MNTVSIFLTVLGPRTDGVRNYCMYKIPENADHGGLLCVIHAIYLFIDKYSYILSVGCRTYNRQDFPYFNG